MSFEGEEKKISSRDCDWLRLHNWLINNCQLVMNHQFWWHKNEK